MKKNKFMRVASVLLVLTLLSACAISGTYAKYVTTTTGGDEARVAVWDITANFEEADDDGEKMFKKNYGTTVASSKEDKLVAPGTDDSYYYQMTGTPEVSYDVTFAIDSFTDLTLKAGTYTFADPYQNMTVTATEDYLPLVWTVTIATTDGTLKDTGTLEDLDLTTAFTAGTARNFKSLADVQTALSTVTISYDPNKECDAKVTIAWAWEFEETADTYTDQDRMDTVLGYYVANTVDSVALPFTAGDGAGAVTDVAYDFSMTATQVD